MDKTLRILKTAIEGFEALEIARTKFYACELESAKKIEELSEKLLKELIQIIRE